MEAYLTSVISSEMGADGSIEFLKAHAITSRSWLLAQLELSRALKNGSRLRIPTLYQEAGRIIRWYDREDHDLFDVCADDHCQRYQGTTKAFTPAVEQAVRDTRGMVLMNGDEICDARFSKSCGGVSELFENAWGADHHDYLIPVRDQEGETLPDLTDEQTAIAWIVSSPPSYCNVTDPAVIRRILPSVDRETVDSYRWTVTYSQEELAEIIKKKSGIDFGEIVGLVPVRRGPSGRIVELHIQGTKTSLVVGKELEIRRFLSPAHLYSSAFVVETEPTVNGIPSRFTFRGAGWGHGVGLCQIGAGVMGEHGFSCEDILRHYFPGSALGRLYR